ncbi:MAG: TetR/AcrR family transcriptional regulator C-terminal ligand-binding domain-containing protein [Cellulomonas sp.]|nr:TetR/AcrR family transcriptional regulator C-terminal ligand-binding domain-containing protein [Cellulomonas sp.]MCR6649937.1 TetR/AcrR family transcriptional regulator C-terminal ligand-binding domain-containing protein [Cellulomonas sp.]
MVTAPRPTGNVRDDVLALLRQANERRFGIAVHLVAALGEFFRETGTTLGGLRDGLLAGHVSGMDQVLDRAVERGEVPGIRLDTDQGAVMPG